MIWTVTITRASKEFGGKEDPDKKIREVESLAGLDALIRELGDPVILSQPEDGKVNLTIYDDWIE